MLPPSVIPLPSLSLVGNTSSAFTSTNWSSPCDLWVMWHRTGDVKKHHLWQEEPSNRNVASLGLSQLQSCKWLLLSIHHWCVSRTILSSLRRGSVQGKSLFFWVWNYSYGNVHKIYYSTHFSIVQFLIIFILLGQHHNDISHFQKMFFYLPQVKLYILKFPWFHFPPSLLLSVFYIWFLWTW